MKWSFRVVISVAAIVWMVAIGDGVIAQTTEPAWTQMVTAAFWPVATVILVVFLTVFISCNSRLARLLGLSAKIVRKIKAGGVEMEINADAVEKVRSHLRDSFSELVANARDEYDRMADLLHLRDHLAFAVNQALSRVLTAHHITAPLVGLRATIHVQDILLKDYLYQLLAYFPGRDGVGRRFPHGFGIIGRSWRLGESLGEGNAVSGPTAQRKLIEEWGMTKEDTMSNSRARPSYLCIILKGTEEETSLPIGILFIDATNQDAFGTGATAVHVARSLEKEPEVLNLSRALSRAMAPLRLAAPNIDVRNP